MMLWFRPQGSVRWVFDRLSSRDWSLLGCLSSELRSAAIWEATAQMRDLISRAHLVKIRDPIDRAPQIRERLLGDTLTHLNNFSADRTHSIQSIDLMCRTEEIVTLARDAFPSRQNVIVDISSLPKRFFFPIVFEYMRDTAVRNLVAVYAVPDKYTQGPLSESHDTPRPILPFVSRAAVNRQSEYTVIGVGFVPLGIQELFSGRRPTGIRLLLPFPPGAPNYNRNWLFIKDIEEKLGSIAPNNLLRTDALDCSNIFDICCKISDNSKKFITLAPFGPKPISLGMCLFACASLTEASEMGREYLNPCEVMYTQPKQYDPEYSKGIKRDRNNVPIVFAYALKIDGRNLYSLPR